MEENGMQDAYDNIRHTGCPAGTPSRWLRRTSDDILHTGGVGQNFQNILGSFARLHHHGGQGDYGGSPAGRLHWQLHDQHQLCALKLMYHEQQ